MPTDLDLRLVRTFVVLVAEQGFTPAAVVMGVSQPALSQAVRRLEHAVGAPLVDRGQRHHGPGITLTPAGAAFHVAALELLARAERAVAEAQRLGERPRLVVGFGTSTPRSLIGVVAREGEALGVDVEFEHVLWGAEPERLAAGRIDLLVAQLATDDDHPGWTVTPLAHRPRVAVFRTDHPLARRTSVALAELAEEPVVDAGSDRDYWIVSPRPDGREPMVVGPAARTVEEMFASVTAGRGMAFTSSTVGENAGGTGLAFVPVRDLAPVVVAMVRRTTDERPDSAALAERVAAAWDGGGAAVPVASTPDVAGPGPESESESESVSPPSPA